LTIHDTAGCDMGKLQAASTSIPVYPKGAFLSPLLYELYTSDETKLGTFADYTAIFATHEDPTIASLNLQEHLHIIEKWLTKWKITVNESKSLHITFNLLTGHCPAVNIN
jgi:hypothetical protein